MIIGFMASFAEHKNNLKQTINSIISQIDHLYIYPNDYTSVPSQLLTPKISQYKHQPFSEQGVVILTLNDTIVYPDDYVHKLTNNCVETVNQVDHKEETYIVKPKVSRFSRLVSRKKTKSINHTIEEKKELICNNKPEFQPKKELLPEKITKIKQIYSPYSLKWFRISSPEDDIHNLADILY